MMPHNIQQLERLIENGLIKLEITGGIPTWEALPASRHQKAAKRIEESIQPLPGSSCGCYSLADTYISFPDGSLKRPDISIFCDEPPDSDEALEVIPVAVIEIVSPDKESARKDLELNPPVYLPAGVLDVIAFDPRTKHITWWDTDTGVEEPRQMLAPQTLTLRCGCQVTIG
jgi:Uma2 family endonuclease